MDSLHTTATFSKLTFHVRYYVFILTSSATGNVKLFEIDENGAYVRVHNTSGTRTEDIGGYLLQQNVAGHPVAVFRFPPRTKLRPGHTATVIKFDHYFSAMLNPQEP